MERCFIATKESKWLKDYNNYREKAKQQRKFADEFFKEKGIDGQHYLISGNGMMNRPFEEFGKKNIRLSIEPTENNLDKFEKILSKVGKYGLCEFRKNSSINKEFQQRCIDEKVVINLWEPDIRDYFKNLRWKGCSYQGFKYKGTWYMKLESEFLKEDDTPEGFKEIKASEYYMVKEKMEEEKKGKDDEQK